MDVNSGNFHLNPEHRAFVKDLTAVIVSYTPVSGVVDTVRFGHKWFGKRKVGHRIAKQIKRRNRRSYIKGRGRRIASKRRRSAKNTI
jgi:hypothetical protein